MAADLKKSYQSITREEALPALDKFSDRWDNKYPRISRSWSGHWQNLNTLFNYPEGRNSTVWRKALQSCLSKLHLLTAKQNPYCSREVRSIQHQMKLASFDFIQSKVNEELITALHHCEFMEKAQSIVFVGPGTDETLLATAIAVGPFSTIINLFAFYQLLSWLTC